MADKLQFDILASDQASANIGRTGKSMKSLAADVELANVRMAKATDAADTAVKKYGKDSLQAKEALAKLAKAEDSAESATRKLGAAQNAVQEDIAKTAAEAEKSSGKLNKLKTAALAGGAAAAGALAKGLSDNLSIDAGRAKLAAQLGLTGDAAATAGRIAGQVYRDNFGESMDEAAAATRVVYQALQQLGESSPGQIQKTTEAALTLASTFDVDVTESTRAAANMVKNGLAKNSTEAFDIIAKGMQKGLNSSDDLLDTLNEYSPQFHKLGLSGRDALNLVSEGMQAGARDTDMISDAIKEFSIRAIDGSKTTVDGFTSIGLSADATAEAIGRGGDSARRAFGQVLDGVRAIKDPVEQSRVGVELFGTKWEDLGPKVVTSLSLTRDAIGQTTGAIDGMQKTLGETGAARIETFKRQVEGLVQAAAGAPGALGAAVAGVAAVGPSALDAAGNIGSLITGFKDLNIESGKLKGVAVGIGKVAAALAAAQIANSALSSSSGAKGIETTHKALNELLIDGRDTSGTLRNLQFDLGNLSASGRGVGAFIENFTGWIAGERSIENVDQRIAALDTTLASLVRSGNTAEAARDFNALTAIAKEQGTSIDVLKNAFPQYQNALDGVANGQKAAGDTANQTSLAVDKEKAAFQAATQAANDHAQALLSQRGDEVGYWAAVQATTDALKQNGKTLDVHSEKGRANRTALDAQARAANAYLTSLQAQGGPAADFNRNLDDAKKRLYTAALQFGYTKDQARAYTDEVLGIPKVAPTQAELAKAAAEAAIAQWRARLASIPRSSTTRINAVLGSTIARLDGVIYRVGWINGHPATVRVNASAANVREGRTAGGRYGGWVSRQVGGWVPGSASGPNRDSVPSMLVPGEFVVERDRAQQNRRFLEDLNAGRVRGYAGGGTVGMVGVKPSSSGQVLVQLTNTGVITTSDVDDWVAERVRKLQRTGIL